MNNKYARHYFIISIFIATTLLLLFTAAGVDKTITQTNRLFTSGNAVKIVIENGYAFLLDSKTGLHIIDITEKTEPVIIATIPTSINDFAVRGDVIYCAVEFRGLQIYSITEPDKPIAVATLPFKNNPVSMVISETTLLIATTGFDDESSILSVDIKNDSAPVITKTYSVTGKIKNISASGRWLFAATGKSGISVIEIGTGSNSTLDIDGDIKSVVCTADYTFLLEGLDTLTVLKNSELPQTSVVSRFILPVPAISIDVIDKQAFISAGNFGIVVLNITDPYAITTEKRIQTGSIYQSSTLYDNTLFIADSRRGLVIKPEHSVDEDISVLFTGGLTRDLYIDGDYCYCIDFSTGLVIFNIKKADKPILISSNSIPDKPLAILVENDYAYITTDNEDLLIFSLDNLRQPHLIKSIRTYDQCTGIYKYNDLVYISGKIKTHIVNAANPEQAAITGSTSHSNQVIATKEYIFFAGSNGLTITKNGDPLLQPIATLPETGSINSITIKQSTVFCTGYGKIITVDISDPARPAIQQTFKTSGDIRNLYIEKNRLYASAGSAGIHYLEMDTDGTIKPVSTFKTDGTAWRVQSVNNYIYVADYHGGLVVLSK